MQTWGTLPQYSTHGKPVVVRLWAGPRLDSGPRLVYIRHTAITAADRRRRAGVPSGRKKRPGGAGNATGPTSHNWGITVNEIVSHRIAPVNPDAPPRRSIGDLLNILVPALELGGWAPRLVSDDGLTVGVESTIRVWLDYDETTPVIGPPAPNRLTPAYLAGVRWAVGSYDEKMRAS